jgi:hypothetical protein
VDNILSLEDIHEGILLSDLSVNNEHLLGVPVSLGMVFIALEVSHAWSVESESCEAVRRLILHVSRVQYDGAVILEDELAHHL